MMQINLDPTAITKAVNGNKTYLSLAAGALVIVANHYGLLPANMVPQNLNPGNWISDLYTVVVVGFFRSAMKKLETPNPTDTQKSTGG